MQTTARIIPSPLLKKFKSWKDQLSSSLFLLNSIDKNTADRSASEFITGITFLELISGRINGLEVCKDDGFNNILNKFHSVNRLCRTSFFDSLLSAGLKADDEITSGIISGIADNYKQYLSADSFGSLYEYLEYSTSGERKKHSGIFYTPVYIVDYIVENTLGRKLQSAPGSLHEIKIYDPSCGAGIFLLRAYDYMVNHLNRNGYATAQQRVNILRNNIFGTDIETGALEVTKLSLQLKLIECGISDLPDLNCNFHSNNFLFDKTPLFDFFSGGFDVIIGNPPYNARLGEPERKALKKAYRLGTTDTAALFIYLADERSKEGAVNGFIIPKPFVYSSNWKVLREKFLPGIIQITDCGRVWNEVKLEQVIYFYEKGSTHKSYISGLRTGTGITVRGDIEKQYYNQFGLLLNGISGRELELALKMRQSGIFLNDIIENHRGASLQKIMQQEPSDFSVIGGKQLAPFTVSKGEKGFLPLDMLNDSKAIIKEDSVLVQNIVAFVSRPFSHIKIIASLASSFEYRNYLLLDTVNQLKNKGIYSAEFICALLNSDIVSWYVYNFIFGRAIRTMHFDNFVTARIPVPRISPHDIRQRKEYEKLKQLVIKITDRQKQHLQNPHKSPAVPNDYQSIHEDIEKIILKFYGISPGELNEPGE